MAIQVPLLNGGNVPLRQTGISVPRTAQLQAGDTGLGRAVSQIGADLGQLAEREQRANDARQMLEFETAMRAAEERQQIFQQETQEQDAWLPNWQTQEQELQKSLEKMKLSPDARMTLQSTLGRYVDNKRMSIREQAVNQAETRARTGFGNRIMQAKTKEEVNTAISLIPPDMMSPEEKERLRISGEKKVEADQLASLGAQESELIRLGAQGDANAWLELSKIYKQKKDMGELDPKTYELKVKQAMQGQLQSDILSQVNGSAGKVDITGARKMVEQYDLPQGVKEDLRREIDSYEKKYGNEEILKAMDDLATGKLTAGAQFDSQYLRPSAVAEVRDAIDKARPPSPEDEVEMYLGGMKAIENLDPELIKRNDPEESLEFVKVAAAIRRAPAHVRDRMADALRGKLSGGADVSANATAMRLARDTLGDILTAKKSDYFEMKDGRQLIKPAKVGDWIKEQARIMSMENEFEKRIKAIPNPTDKQYIETLNAVMGQDVTAARQRVYLPPTDSGFEAVPDKGPLRLDLPARSGSTAFPMINPLLFGTP